jgi:transcriptional regulator with XRE-family HTH domain
VKKPKHASVGERIAFARNEYGLSQAQLGANLRVTRAAVSQYEQDKIRPRPVVIERLAALFNADPEWFDRGRGKAPNPLDAPVAIPEINGAALTPEITDPRELATGRQWRIPAETVVFMAVDPGDNLITLWAPNDADHVRRGDRVVIDTRRDDGGDGVFLIASEAGARLYRGCDAPTDAKIVGRVVGYLRIAL